MPDSNWPPGVNHPFDKPTLTFDVNAIALKHPSTWPPDMQGIAELEYNYFVTGQIDLCVTPQTYAEISQGTSLAHMGSTAYARFTKSEMFETRPDGTTLTLSDQAADATWTEMRRVLWPSVSDSLLTPNQRADVTQIFFHYAAGGTLANSAFVTRDSNFYRHGNELFFRYGIQVMRGSEAWSKYRNEYGLDVPTEPEVESLFSNQKRKLAWEYAKTQAGIPKRNL